MNQSKVIFFLLSLILINDKIILAQNYVNSSSCSSEDCHGNIFSTGNIHPALEDGCFTCHQSDSDKFHPTNEGNEFVLIENKDKLCFDCHDVHEGGNFVHLPVKSGECISCHNPHSSPNKNLLKEYIDSRLCEKCHDLDYWQDRKAHGPIAGGKCFECHEPHVSKFKNLLKRSTKVLCFNCHEDIKKSNLISNIHVPFNNNCLSCHNSHSGLKSGLLNSSVSELCFKCHDNVRIISEKSKYKHVALSNSRQCMNCHSPHASNEKNLLILPQDKTCFKCHNKEIRSTNRIIANIETRIKVGKYIHEPLENGCSECHESHDESLTKNELTMNGTNFRNASQNLHYVHLN